jgi:hypothetical protein
MDESQLIVIAVQSLSWLTAVHLFCFLSVTITGDDRPTRTSPENAYRQPPLEMSTGGSHTNLVGLCARWEMCLAAKG